MASASVAYTLLNRQEYLQYRCGAIVLSCGRVRQDLIIVIKQYTFLTPFFMSNNLGSEGG